MGNDVTFDRVQSAWTRLLHKEGEHEVAFKLEENHPTRLLDRGFFMETLSLAEKGKTRTYLETMQLNVKKAMGTEVEV